MSAAAVFVGPSLEPAQVKRAVPHVRIEPPAARGDLVRLHAEGVRTFLLIDGAFTHRPAVSPREIVEVLDAGARVLGAASMGAIRAAECWPAGMQGIGAIHQLYRWRVISSDDEVAVAVEPEHDHRAVSVALVNVRFAALAGLRQRLLSHAQAAALLDAVKATYFSERRWEAIFAAAGIRPTAALRALCTTTDVKRRDAKLAVQRLAALPPPDPSPRRFAAESGPRYRGHDPLLGREREELEPELWRWLLASGRYRRYLRWEMASPSELWDALVAEHELEPELMRWYAISRGNRAPHGTADAAELDAMASAHGFGTWKELAASQRFGVLPAGVPLAWVRKAALSRAEARRSLAD